MRAQLYPIADCPTGRLAILARPRAGEWLDEEIQSWGHRGIESVVSMLEDGEVAELGLQEQPLACERAAIQFRRFPVPDRGTPPSRSAFGELVTELVFELRSGRGVGIHCRMGVGRSASLAVCVLLALGVASEEAWAMIERSRGRSVPDTAAQREWVDAWNIARLLD